MTDTERAKSILSEIEHGYIGYDNMHGDDAHGLSVIKKALNEFLRGCRNNEINKLNSCDTCGKRETCMLSPMYGRRSRINCGYWSEVSE